MCHVRTLTTSFVKHRIFRRGVPVKGLQVTYWFKTQLFNFWASYKVVYSESFNFYFLGFWASRVSVSGFAGVCLFRLASSTSAFQPSSRGSSSGRSFCFQVDAAGCPKVWGFGGGGGGGAHYEQHECLCSGYPGTPQA